MAGGHGWRGGMCGKGMGGRGTCMAGGMCIREVAMHGWGACVAGGMCGRGVCMAGGVHCKGHAWQGVCMADTMRYGQ